jgi:hypothetical protein
VTNQSLSVLSWFCLISGFARSRAPPLGYRARQRIAALEGVTKQLETSGAEGGNDASPRLALEEVTKQFGQKSLPVTSRARQSGGGISPHASLRPRK